MRMFTRTRVCGTAAQDLGHTPRTAAKPPEQEAPTPSTSHPPSLSHVHLETPPPSPPFTPRLFRFIPTERSNCNGQNITPPPLLLCYSSPHLHFCTHTVSSVRPPPEWRHRLYASMHVMSHTDVCVCRAALNTYTGGLYVWADAKA